jgi:ribose-phosphate pyrophosphokinase
MIKIETLDRTDNHTHVLTPTIFPDGTSQCWKLPEAILKSNNVKITWNFENEAELIHLCSLRKLIKQMFINLHIPYLPYARQDKSVSNSSTFNLETFGDILNAFNFHLITSVDVHNPKYTAELIPNFHNMEVNRIHEKLIQKIKPDLLLFPDAGAQQRYDMDKMPRIIGSKFRNQLTGELADEYKFTYDNPFDFETMGYYNITEDSKKDLKPGSKILIIDDICDGGRTFINLVTALKKFEPNLEFSLFVTHGIFSKGKQVLHDSGISNIYTTNSLLKNEDGFKV